jgi:polyhydroxybutyrate depolymerase
VDTPKRAIMPAVAVAAAVAALLAAGLAARPATAGGRDAVHALPGGRLYVTHHPGRSVSAAVVVLHSLHHDWHEGPALGWSAESDRSGFLTVYPDGSSGSWNAGLCCAPANDPVRYLPGPGSRVGGRDDVAFLDRVIADVRARYRVRYVWLAGYSNGGMMAERLVATKPWLSGRLAVWASAPEMPFPGAWTGRAWLGHGALDTTVPWQGGLVTLAGRQVLIRPGQATPRYLLGARLSAHVYPGVGHAPPSWWPATAWKALSAP